MGVELAPKFRVALNLQRAVSYLNLPWFGPLFVALLRGAGSYSCTNLTQVRQKTARYLREAGSSPVVICANHLTMIDSLLITLFLSNPASYFKHFSRFPWNVPEQANFGKNLPLKLMCYLGKCVYVQRQGSLASKRLAWDKVKYLLSSGELVCIFPEGGRSRSGKLDMDGTVYGTGQLLQEIPDLKVLCVYLRGEGQKTYSFLPKKGESFYMDVELISPMTSEKGRRGARDLTLQVMKKLKDMEETYFARPR